MPDSPIATRIPNCPQCNYAWESLPEVGRCPECRTQFDQHSNRWPLVQTPPSVLQRIAEILFLLAWLAFLPYLYPSGPLPIIATHSIILFVISAIIWHSNRLARLASRGKYLRAGWVIILSHTLIITKGFSARKPKVHPLNSITAVVGLIASTSKSKK